MHSTSNLETYFRWLTIHPKKVIGAGLLLMAVAISNIPNITQDTRADAFLADDNPALVYRDKIKSVFGLSDPLVIAVTTTDSIFTKEGLNTVYTLTELMRNAKNIDPDGITSLATENNIEGSEDGLEVEAFYEEPLTSESQALKVRDAIRDFPLYQGSLVAHDETATLIIAELIDESKTEESYQTLLADIESAQISDNFKIHIAGEGAVSGYLGAYIASDAQRLNPLAGVIISIIVFFAFLRLSTTLMANLIILASVSITVGTMAALGVPFYVITNALPVILIGIAVADAIHIYSEYFERRALFPTETVNDAIVSSMMAMGRPITLTTITTIAGFLGLAFAAYMPPFKSFGFFTSVGVAAAWLFSMSVLPAAMSLIKTETHPFLAKKISSNQTDFFARVMVWLGKLTQANYKSIVITAALLGLVGTYAASQIVVNEDRIATFHSDEAIYKADSVINTLFDGSNFLDIVIESDEVEGLFEPSALLKMEALQTFTETLPHVQGSTSIVDYMKQMNRSLNGGEQAQYVLPTSRDLVAQYFLLYSASSAPTDFEEEIDYDYRLANIRVSLNTGSFVSNKHVVEEIQTYVDTEFMGSNLTVHISGRVNLTYHWIKDLGKSHFLGMAIAMSLVFLASSILFGSATAGLYAIIPVATSILLVYSSMVLMNIPLGIGTSMFAAVAIGLGVDFAIHTIDRLKAIQKETGEITATLARFYPSTGRALLFNALAITLGFGVLITSKVVPLNNFGTIVAISVITSFVISMVLIPAMALWFQPAFLTSEQATSSAAPASDIGAGALGSTANSFAPVLIGGGLVAVAILLSLLVFTPAAKAAELDALLLPQGEWVIRQINNVDEGISVKQKLTMKLTDRRGKSRQRSTINFRKYFGDEKRTVLFYLEPKNVKDTAFLTYDYPDVERDDDQWLYLPALRKARRISASDRGDYFLGTDFTYEDIKKNGKIETSDYNFSTLKKMSVDNNEVYLVELLPKNKTIAKELGYGKVHLWVRSDNWQSVRAHYWDTKLNDLKHLEVSQIELVDDIWTRHKLVIDNIKTGHKTEFVFSDVDYRTEFNDQVFARQSLKRGVPE